MDIEAARRDGYSDAEITEELAKRTRFDLQKARADGYGDSEIMGELQRRQTANLSKMDTKPGSVGERFARGVAEPFVGAAQLVMKGAGALGLPQEYVDTQQDFTKEFVGKSDAIAPQGDEWDVARVAGNVLPLLATGGRVGAAPTIGRLAGAGAVAGGIGGATIPVTDENFWGTKAFQTGAGTAFGAAANPLMNRILQAAGRKGASALNAIRSRLPGGATPQQIQITISQSLRDSGIDPATVPPAFMQQIQDEVGRALNAGGTLDARALAANADAALLRTPPPTAGQATQNPTQWGQERWLAQAPEGQPLATQYLQTLETLNNRLGDLQGRAAAPVSREVAGQKVMGTLQRADARGAGFVDNLYQTVRAHPDADLPIDYRTVAQSVADQLYERSLFGALPPTLRTPIQNTVAGRGAQQAGWRPTIRTADDINKTISQEIAKAEAKGDGSALQAIDVYRRTLNEAVQDAANNAPPGSTIARDLFTARNAASQRFGIHDAIPALEAAVKGSVAPDDFIRRYVMGGAAGDFRNLAEFVQQADPQVWNQIRGQVLDQVRRTANASEQPGQFSQAAYNKAIRGLRDSGRLDVLFDAEERAMLDAIGRAGARVQQPPPGVSLTGFGGTAKQASMLAQVIGRLGKFATGSETAGRAAEVVARRGMGNAQVSAALQPTPNAAPGVTSVLPQVLTNRLSLGLSQGAPSTARNALYFDAADPRGTMQIPAPAETIY